MCAKIAGGSLGASGSFVLTNLGISPRLRCEVPVAKTSYAFGRPKNSLSERATLALVQELAVDCPHFIDVGANDGIFTFFVSRSNSRSQIQIHWFEPDHDIHERLARNLRSNAIETHGNRAAVVERTGTISFFKNLTADSSGSVTDYFALKHETVVQQVPAIRLSDYFRDHQVHDALVKIDVEGGGCAAWSGASGVMGDITYLVMEMLSPEIQNGLPARIITEGAFHAYYVKDFELVESLDGDFDYVEPYWNWFFCKLEPASLARRLSRTRFHVVQRAWR